MSLAEEIFTDLVNGWIKAINKPSDSRVGDKNVRCKLSEFSAVFGRPVVGSDGAKFPATTTIMHYNDALIVQWRDGDNTQKIDVNLPESVRTQEEASKLEGELINAIVQFASKTTLATGIKAGDFIQSFLEHLPCDREELPTLPSSPESGSEDVVCPLGVILQYAAHRKPVVKPA